ncbi:Peptidase S28, partial [Corchorus olitorius]
MASSLSLFFFLFFIAFSATLTIPANSLPTFFPRATYSQSLIKHAKTPKPKLPFKTHYFPQTLDHFTFQPKSSKIFYQKYLINTHYWHKGGPIFVYTGNEGNIEWFAANTGFMLDIAPKFKALLVFIE